MPEGHSFRHILRKFTRNLADYGARTALAKTAAALLSVVYEHTVYRVYRREIVAADAARAPRLPASLTISVMDRSHPDESAVRQIEQMEEWLEGEVGRKLKKGGLGIVIRDGDLVAGFCLVAFARVHMGLVRQDRMLQEDEAWSEQITVRRAYRRRGLGTALRYRTFQELNLRGIRWLYGGTLPANAGSLAFTRKLGFREVEDIHYRRVLGSVSVFTERLRP